VSTSSSSSVSNSGLSDQCACCNGKYGDSSHSKNTDDWLQCIGCAKLFYETCAESIGIVDVGDVFSCDKCVDC
jgi:hypothetical protein